MDTMAAKDWPMNEHDCTRGMSGVKPFVSLQDYLITGMRVLVWHDSLRTVLSEIEAPAKKNMLDAIREYSLNLIQYPHDKKG